MEIYYRLVAEQVFKISDSQRIEENNRKIGRDIESERERKRERGGGSD